MKCAFCRTERDDLITVQITEHERGWVKASFGRQKWGTILVKKPYQVCPDKPCGGNLQMSREG
jgi:hypothetical protein